MKTASITQTKNQLSSLIEEVKRGETVLILDRGAPVARLTSAVSGTNEDTTPGTIERLERSGIVKRAETAPAASIWNNPPPRLRGDASILDALLTERTGDR
jgi:prevent-host-death family protein